MVFKSPRSKCVHKSLDCVHAKNAIQVDMKHEYTKCKLCFPVTCFICQSDRASVACPCEDQHSLCRSCMLEYVDHVRENATWDGNLQCPCGKEGTFTKLAWMYQRKLIRNTSPPPLAKRSHLDIIEQDVLTSRCPHCHAVFFDFDGCAAIQCLCNGFFCAICMKPFANSDDCHRHLLECNGQYFVQLDYWRHLHACYKLKLLLKFVWSLFWETRSALYALGLLSLSLKHVEWTHIFTPRECKLACGATLIMLGSMLC